MTMDCWWCRQSIDRPKLARDPKQHDDCGKLFCSECIEKHGGKPCPNCRAENPQYFKDRRSLREIRDLRVRCDNVERGCNWKETVGMLDNHVTNCGFTLVSCPNKCKVEGEESQVMRKDLDDHLMTKCPNRGYECKHCGEKGTYASITEEHDSVCNKKIVPCPNTECNSALERGLTKKHVQTVCKYNIVACKYASIGCSVKTVRMVMDQHEEDHKSHLHLTLENIVKLEKKIVKLENTISSLNASTSSLKVSTSSLKDTTSSQNATISLLENTMSSLKKNMYTLKRDKSISFNLPRYSKKKEDDVIFYSEPFYTSPGGYKMCITVYPNGDGSGKDTHVSVYSQLLKGPYDDNVTWPFLGTVTVSLLNQLADDDHHSRMIPFKTSYNAQAGNILGFGSFLSHSKLSHNHARNTQYLMEDTLYFRVKVNVDHHKPWLDCSYHTT